MNKVMKITDLRDEASQVRDYQEISGMTEQDARQQYSALRKALLPKKNRVVFCLDDENLADLKAEAKAHKKTLGEVVRGRLRIAERAMQVVQREARTIGRP
jgi:hypothetical protein